MRILAKDLTKATCILGISSVYFSVRSIIIYRSSVWITAVMSWMTYSFPRATPRRARVAASLLITGLMVMIISACCSRVEDRMFRGTSQASAAQWRGASPTVVYLTICLINTEVSV